MKSLDELIALRVKTVQLLDEMEKRLALPIGMTAKQRKETQEFIPKFKQHLKTLDKQIAAKRGMLQ